MNNSSYLNADSANPLISCDQLQDELILYNLSSSAYQSLEREFFAITGKALNRHSNIMQLSGGQKVILMALLALFSPAPRIRFINLFQALDPQRRMALEELIKNSDKCILTEDSSC